MGTVVNNYYHLAKKSHFQLNLQPIRIQSTPLIADTLGPLHLSFIEGPSIKDRCSGPNWECPLLRVHLVLRTSSIEGVL